MAYGFQSLGVTLDGTPVDAASSGATQISGDIVGTGQHFSPLRVIIETVEVDSVTGTAIITIGNNSPDYDNVLSEHAIRPLSGNVEIIPLTQSKVITAGALKVNVRTPANATELTFVAGVECLNYAWT